MCSPNKMVPACLCQDHHYTKIFRHQSITVYNSQVFNYLGTNMCYPKVVNLIPFKKALMHDADVVLD